jgi:hypothetical protein
MAERNVPDAITPGVMQNSQDNRGAGNTDISRAQQSIREMYNGEERRRTTSDEWSGARDRRKRNRTTE